MTSLKTFTLLENGKVHLAIPKTTVKNVNKIAVSRANVHPTEKVSERQVGENRKGCWTKNQTTDPALHLIGYVSYLLIFSEP